MKNLVVLLLAFLSFSFVFSQDKTANFGNDSKSYSANKSKGIYVFHVDGSQFSQEDIIQAAKYYKDYFLVSAKKSSDQIKVQISLKENSVNSKNIIQRYFVGLGLKFCTLNGNSYSPIEFHEKFI